MINFKFQISKKAPSFFLLFVICYLLFVITLPVFAQQNPPTVDLLVKDLPGIGPATDLKGFLQGIFKLTLGIAVTAAIAIIVWNGIRYMVSDAVGGKEDARKWIGEALWGLVLAFSAVLILSTINPQLTQFDFLTTLQEVREAAGGPPGGPPPPPPPPGDTPPDGQFTYQPRVAPQRLHASSQLETLLSCIANRVPGNVGEISSISDEMITSGQRTFEECAAGGQSVGCAH
mgnify:FL=1